MKTHYLLATLPALLFACDQEKNYYFGGTSETGETNEVTIPNAKSELANGDLTKTSDGTVTGLEFDANSDEVVITGLDQNGNAALYVNGSEPSIYQIDNLGSLEGGTTQVGAIFGSYEQDGTHNSFAIPINNLEEQGVILAMREGALTQYTWENIPIEYAYMVTQNDGEVTHYQGSSGTITIEGDQWTANFNDAVLLDGNILGTNVSGMATLGDMQGEFDGVDGYYFVNGAIGAETGGAFEGDNGDQSSFSGGWSGSR